MWQYLKQCYVPPKEKEKDEKITQINGKLLVSLPKQSSEESWFLKCFIVVAATVTNTQ